MLDVVREERTFDLLQLRGQPRRDFSVVLEGLGIENVPNVLYKVCNHVEYFGTFFENQLQCGEKMCSLGDVEEYSLDNEILKDVRAFEDVRADLYKKFNKILVDRIVEEIVGAQ